MKTGSHHSPEGREKIRETRLGTKSSPETRERVRQGNLGRPVSPETRERLRQANLGRKHTPETREKMRQTHLGHSVSPETREKISRTTLGRKVKASPERREKIRQARLRQRFPLTDIERVLLREFKRRRLKFEDHKAMFGRWQPDFVFGGAKLIVQADGAFWHNRRNPRNARSVACDEAFNAKAAVEGWTVWRFSDSEITDNPEACGRAVAVFVRRRRHLETV